MLHLQDAILIFIGIVLEAMPFVMLGAIASALLHVFVSDKRLIEWIPRSFLGKLLFGSLLGAIFPVCECGNMPVARRLLAKGADPMTVVVFLLTAPVVNPVVLLSTWAAFRTMPDMVWLRLLLTLLVAWTIGWVFRHATLEEVATKEVQTFCETEHHHHGGKFATLLRTSVREFFDVSSVLLLGAALAAIVQVAVPREMLLMLAQGPVLSILTLQLLAFVISICSNVDAFFILGFTRTFAPPAVLSFLVLGPMVDIKSLVMLSSVFQRRVLLIMTALIWVLTFFGSLLLSYVF